MEIEPVSSYGLGYQARQSGVPKKDNPFHPVGAMHGNWLTGWDHADEEDRKIKTPGKLKLVKNVFIKPVK